MVDVILQTRDPLSTHHYLAAYVHQGISCDQVYVCHATSSGTALDTLVGIQTPDLSPMLMAKTELTRDDAATLDASPVTPTIGDDVPAFHGVAVGVDLPREQGRVIVFAIRLAPHSPFTTQELEEVQEVVGRVAVPIKTAWELMTLRRELTRQQRLVSDAKAATRARAAFMARMNHDLRTPLSSILGFSELLSMSDLSPSQREYVDFIQESGETLVTRIDEMLDLSLAESGKLTLMIQPVNVASTLVEASESLNAEALGKGLRFQFLGPAAQDMNNILVLADPERFKQVLLNVLDNAIEHALKDSTITVTVALTPNGKVEFRVIDVGPGMPVGKLNEIFRPTGYFSVNLRATEPSGLGLPLTKALLEAMGGSIRGESVVGQGSTIVFDLPRYTKAPSDK